MAFNLRVIPPPPPPPPQVRLKWLRGRVDDEEGESDGETAALR